MEDDPINYIDFSHDCVSNEMEYVGVGNEIPDEMEDDISNDLPNNMSIAIPLSPTKNAKVSIEVGMEFPEWKDIVNLYTAFGRIRGFGIRRRTSREDYVKLTCIREGHPQTKKEENVGKLCEAKSRRTSSSRIGCEACVKASRNKKTNMWRITHFIDNHNHEMVTPKSVTYLRSHRKMPDAAKCLVEKFNNSSLPTGKVATIFKSHDLGFDSRDCYNHMKNVRRKIYDAGDAQAVLHYCIKQQALNLDFFYSIKCDDDDRMVSFFWIDARSRHAYKLFGDVITFDTTYRTNKYYMPFGPFVGVNNHMQSLLLGCALLQDETEDTFIWLFEEWLRAMNGKHPVAIITDQDMAISNAVAKVFPNTKHRFCLWHIMKKFPEKLSHVYHEHASFKKNLNECIWSSKSAEEFEERWQHLLIQYSLHGNEWLHGLYSIRSSWVPIFNRSIFFAGMNTTQRSESINSFFDGFVTSGTTLKEFVEKYNQAVDTRYESSKKEDFESKHKERLLTFNMPLEEHAAKVYTRAIFLKFGEELSLSLRLSKEKLGNDIEWVTYHVFNKKDNKDYATVDIKLENKEARCSCLYFEFMGILCRHVLAIFLIENIEQIPEHFILRRWRKEGNDILSIDSNSYTTDGDRLLRSFHLRSRYSRLDELAYASSEAFRFICDGIDSLSLAAEKFVTSEETTSLSDSDLQYLGHHSEESSMRNLKDPYISQTKGRKKDSQYTSQGRRIRSGIEEASKHTNICGICKKRGHNKRTCKDINL
ncbi:protein FAR1-RELATED SEQUENCE 5-like [Gastrolobium bilobum]|uniref:protein FAR1-RELATED SEQUENCE 5-like n=1 Tax=Gastrolobium bilobum TaxID=150636 RepID=UPI002AB0E2D2|nr:protein FAR1-RELATED SEQUENCE 5-like [Gastrolobium bilobum]